LDHRAKFVIDAFGASCTGAALLVIVAAKFAEGAWIVLLVLPAAILLLRAIKAAYQQETRLLQGAGPLTVSDVRSPVVLVPVEDARRGRAASRRRG
jgi:hypothetical protein